MSGAFPTFRRLPEFATRFVRGVWRATRTVARGVRRVWKPVVAVIVIYIAACDVSGTVEWTHAKRPLFPIPYRDPARYKSPKNPERHYEVATRLLTESDVDTIQQYWEQRSGPNGRKNVSQADFAAALAHSRPAIEQARAGANLSVRDFQPPSGRYSVLTHDPEYSERREVAKLVLFDAEDKVAHGNANAGAEELLDLLTMGDGVSRSPDLIGYLTGNAIMTMGYSPLYEIISGGHLAASDYRSVTHHLGDIDADLQPMKEVLSQEYLTARSELRDILWRSPSNDCYTQNGFREPVLSPDLERKLRSEISEITIPWYDRVQMWAQGSLEELYIATPGVKTATIAHFDHIWGKTLEACDKPYPQAVKFDPSRLVPSLDWVNDVFIVDSSKVLRKYATNKTLLEGLMLMSALEAYHLEHGRYPESLDSLVGEYIPRIPSDPFTDRKPFIYKLHGESYILYSVGPDMKDNGGKMTKAYYMLNESTPEDIVFSREMNLRAQKNLRR